MRVKEAEGNRLLANTTGEKKENGKQLGEKRVVRVMGAQLHS